MSKIISYQIIRKHGKYYKCFEVENIVFYFCIENFCTFSNIFLITFV